ADASFELAGHALRFGDGPTGGGLAGEYLLVVAEEDDRRDDRRPVPEVHDRHRAVPVDGRGGVGGSEIDTEVVAQRPSCAATSVLCRPGRFGVPPVGPCPRPASYTCHHAV